jgi:poly(3-hydroxybutyrate) depolymerase
MLYNAYEMQRAWLAGASAAATLASDWWQNPRNPLSQTGFAPVIASGLDVFAHASAARGKPAFGFSTITIDGKPRKITETIAARKAFGQLKHFGYSGVIAKPKLLIIAPMSGHFATLLRGTVERLLPRHNIWITDWRDAKLVPLADGRFDLDDYIDYLIGWLEHIGPGAHVLAVCQPTVPAYAAACLMNARKHRCRPKTLTMMGGPIDTRAAPTEVNTVATQRPLSWFEDNVIQTVPWLYSGVGRRVYPGYLQLSGFMAMNLGNHLMSHWRMFQQLVDGDDEHAEATKEFYDEYRSVCDMTAEYYLQTIDRVFQRHLLPMGEFLHRAERVDPASLTDTALLAIEGERDDISGVGQTKAAVDIATKLAAAKKQYLLAENVGHYGIFNGRRWREQIAPVVEQWIAKFD